MKAVIRDEGGKVTAELPSALSTSFKAGTELSVLPLGSDALLLLREAPKGTAFFAGDLSSLTVGELFGHMVTGMRTGKLLLSHGQVRKSVSFQDGQVVFATSTEPHERLGAALVRLGILKEEQLQDALKKVTPTQKLGQVLRKSGTITAAALYSAMTFIVREIVVDLFQMIEGSFLFLEGVLPPDTLKLPERTRDLVLEGMARSEEKVREKRLRELEARKAGRPAENVSRVQQYTQFIQEVADAIRAASKEDVADLKSFFEEAPPGIAALFQGVSLGADGKLDVARLSLNAEKGGGGEGQVRGRIYEALGAFASYALFTAKNVLPVEVTSALEQKARLLPESGP
ncbi:MAG: DUF4388 domain-containing protein [Myxococcaceae bacterium]